MIVYDDSHSYRLHTTERLKVTSKQAIIDQRLYHPFSYTLLQRYELKYGPQL